MTEIVMLDGPETRAAEIEAFRTEFLRYAAMPDLSQPCPVGRLVAANSWMDADKRREAIWEIVADAMSEKDDFTRRAMEILCEYGRFDAKARALLVDMAQHWAEQRSEL